MYSSVCRVQDTSPGAVSRETLPLGGLFSERHQGYGDTENNSENCTDINKAHLLWLNTPLHLCVYIHTYTTHLYPLLCWWIFTSLPCHGYRKQCWYEHWGILIFSDYSFLQIYTQEGDGWIINRQSLSRVWLLDSMDASLPDSSAHGVLQAGLYGSPIFSRRDKFRDWGWHIHTTICNRD